MYKGSTGGLRVRISCKHDKNRKMLRTTVIDFRILVQNYLSTLHRYEGC